MVLASRLDSGFGSAVVPASRHQGGQIAGVDLRLRDVHVDRLVAKRRAGGQVDEEVALAVVVFLFLLKTI